MQTPVQYSQSLLATDQNADSIATLPTNQVQPSHNELKIVDTLFKSHGGTMNKIFAEVQDAILIGILFIVVSLPQTDDLLKRLLPMTQNSPYILMLTKAIALIILYWLLKNLWLAKKN